jgi:DNA-binding MarR family transcriptional regulator
MLSVMTNDSGHLSDVVLPVLLRPGRGVYGLFIRDALTEAGFSDMPGNGGYVLGLIAPDGSPFSDVIADLGVSRQNASELVDTLVVRGYLQRTADPADRRRVTLTLTDRGSAASAAVLAAAKDVDARLLAAVGPERMAHTRETLAALLALRSPGASVR